MEMASCRKKLKLEFSRRLGANPNYSLRAFARDLSLYPSQLSEIFNGRKGLSANSMARIGKKLNWQTSRALSVKSGKDLGELTWYHLALLELALKEELSSEPGLIGRRLGISKLAARLALKTLEDRGLLRIQSGTVVAIPDRMFFGDDTPSEAIRRFHREFLALAIRQLELTEFEEREYSATVLALTPLQAQELRRKIRVVVEEFSDYANSASGEKEVFGLSLQMFRITKNVKKNGQQ